MQSTGFVTKYKPLLLITSILTEVMYLLYDSCKPTDDDEDKDETVQCATIVWPDAVLLRSHRKYYLSCAS